MRSASSAGSVLASHSPHATPRIATVPRNTHATGQCSVPAGTNSSAPMTATQMMFCSNNFAITGVHGSWGHHDRIFRQSCDDCFLSPSLPGLTPAIHLLRQGHHEHGRYEDGWIRGASPRMAML